MSKYLELERDVGSILEDAVSRGEAAGLSVLVLKQGEEIVRTHAGRANLCTGTALRDDSICRLYSQSKPVKAAAVMTLVEAGKLDLMDDVGMYLPSFGNLKVLKDGKTVGAARPVMIRDLLSMTSGLVYPDMDLAGQYMGGLFQENERAG